MKHLQLQCKPLDDLLGGGIESNTITEIYGEGGSGKTNFCLQAAREGASLGKKVAFIDSEGVSVERLSQICEGYNFKQILSKILFYNPFSFEEQEKMINNAVEIKDVGLIVVDTFNLFYRIMLEYDKEGAIRSLNRQVTNLQVAAREKDIYVVVAGKVYSTENDDVKPFSWKGVDRMAKTILKLEKTGAGKRTATIIKHRSQTIGRKAYFTITSKGLE